MGQVGLAGFGPALASSGPPERPPLRDATSHPKRPAMLRATGLEPALSFLPIHQLGAGFATITFYGHEGGGRSRTGYATAVSRLERSIAPQARESNPIKAVSVQAAPPMICPTAPSPGN